MALEFPDKLTPLPEDEYILSAAKAWKRFYGRGPQVPQLSCCLAQMILEVGRKMSASGSYVWGAYSHNYNMGNIKSRDGDGQDFQFYACGEEISLKEAQRLQKETPGLIQIKKAYGPDSSQRARVWILPKHSWTRFRAYSTPEEGLVGYMRFLVMERTRYIKAWTEGVMKGDPVKFSMELHKAGYYTADPLRYTKTVVKLFEEFQSKVKAVLESPEGLALYSDELEAQRVEAMNIVALSIQQYLQGEDALAEEDAREAQEPNV